MAALLAAAPAGAQQAPSESAFAAVGQAFADFRAKTPVPGMVYGVVIDGKLLHVGTHGVANVATGAKANASTRFRIASMSKAFTALAILKLRDEGKLGLDDPAERHIPEMRGWRYPTSDSPRIRIRDLLHHVGGLVTDDPWGDRQQAMPAADFSRLIAAGVPFSRPPQTAMEYSNLGYALLGRIVTNASGMPYDRYIVETIMRPLGMTSSGYEFRDVPLAQRALGYRWENERWVEEPTMAHGEFGAMGGVYVTAGDYARWLAFLQSAWPSRNGPETGPVRRSTVRNLAQGLNFLSTRKRIGGAPDDECIWAEAYGMGMRVVQDCTVGLVLSHGGGYPGYGSFVALAPERRAAVFVLTNRTYSGPSEPAWRALLAIDRQGMIPPFKRVVAPVLETMQSAAFAAFGAGDLAPLRGKLAMNFLMDRSAGDWATEFASVKRQVGSCTSTEPLFATGALSTAFRWNCERGHVNGQILLAPTNPPAIQSLKLIPLPN
ncbi:serine hydrolase domain-containing protein [Sphingomonas mesophila]|uniref:serine hydrolase domain-containing protein n=1 Tax=Sphingomonas mesophila TaxID=2303576 RepID=UPI001F0741E7|nr:serine hydrolase domain-containing protein [Sphingomonas mesophila]